MNNNDRNNPSHRTRRGPGARFKSDGTPLPQREKQPPLAPTHKPKFDWRHYPTHYTKPHDATIYSWPESLTPYRHITFIIQLPLENVKTHAKPSPHDYVVVAGIGRVHEIFWGPHTRWTIVRGFTHRSEEHQLP